MWKDVENSQDNLGPEDCQRFVSKKNLWKVGAKAWGSLERHRKGQEEHRPVLGASRAWASLGLPSVQGEGTRAALFL